MTNIFTKFCSAFLVLNFFLNLGPFSPPTSCIALSTAIPPKIVAIIPLYFDEKEYNTSDYNNSYADASEVATTQEPLMKKTSKDNKVINNGKVRVAADSTKPEDSHLMLQNKSNPKLSAPSKLPTAPVPLPEELPSNKKQGVHWDIQQIQNPLPQSADDSSKKLWNFKHVEIKPIKQFEKQGILNDAINPPKRHPFFGDNNISHQNKTLTESHNKPMEQNNYPPLKDKTFGGMSPQHGNLDAFYDFLVKNFPKIQQSQNSSSSIGQNVNQSPTAQTSNNSSAAKDQPQKVVQLSQNLAVQNSPSLYKDAQILPSLVAQNSKDGESSVVKNSRNITTFDEPQFHDFASNSPTTGCYLTDWTVWGPCSDICGGCGHKTRTRRCVNGTSGSWCTTCDGSTREQAACNFRVCLYPDKACCGNLKPATVLNQFTCV